MNNWFTPIDKLTYWKGGEWVKFEAKSSKPILRIHFDQLLITVDNKIIETFNMNSRLRGIYKGDVLILIASVHGQEVRKLKFQIKTDSARCFETLAKHFPINSHKSSSKGDMIFRNAEEIFRQVIEQDGSSGSKIKLPSNYSEFVKICLLDPTFPFVVEETKKIVQSFNTK